MLKLTIKMKATLLATALALSLLAGVGVMQHRQLRDDYLELVQKQQDMLAERAAAELVAKLEIRMMILQHLTTLLDAGVMGNAEAQQHFLARVMDSHSLFDGLILVRPDGTVSASAPSPSSTAISVGDRDYFRAVVATNRTAISTPILARTGIGAAIVLAAPVHDQSGRLIAVLGAGLQLGRENLLGQLAHTPVGTAGRFEVVTTGAHPVYVVHPDRSQLLQDASAQESDQSYVISRRPVAGIDWEVRVVLSKDEALYPVQHARERLLVQLLGLGLAAALAVWCGMHWLMQPLSTLHAAIRQLRLDPDSGTRLDVSGEDERGTIAREFEALMQELRRRQAELAAVTEASSLGFYRAGIDGRLEYVNDAYLRQHGLGQEESGDGWLQLVRPDIRDRIWEDWTAAMSRPTPFSATRALRRRDGREVIFRVISAPLFLQGRFAGHVGSVADITEQVETEKSLRMLTTIFDSTTDYVVQTDRNGMLTYMNPAARRLSGIAPEARLNGRYHGEFNTPETLELLASAAMPRLRSHGVWVGTTHVYDADRTVVPVSNMTIAHRDRSGKVDRFSAVLRNISEEAAVRHQMQLQTATLQSVTEAIPARVSVIGSDLRFRFANVAFEEWVRAQRHFIIGRTMEEVLGSVQFTACAPWAQRALGGASVNFQIEVSRVAGETGRFYSLSYIPLRLEDGSIDGFVAVAQNITEHKQQELRLLRMAQRDGLTGLLNRAGFEAHLDQQQKDDNARDVAILYIDLDRFKPVNDQYGHPTGDELLKLFAIRLSSLVRPTDAVARIGGDEFAVVLHAVHGLDNAQRIADKIAASTVEPFEIGALRLHIGASVGVAFSEFLVKDWSTLIAKADALLYQVKEAGRGRDRLGLH